MEYLGIPFSKKQTLDLEMEIFKNANFKVFKTSSIHFLFSRFNF